MFLPFLQSRLKYGSNIWLAFLYVSIVEPSGIGASLSLYQGKILDFGSREPGSSPGTNICQAVQPQHFLFTFDMFFVCLFTCNCNTTFLWKRDALYWSFSPDVCQKKESKTQCVLYQGERSLTAAVQWSVVALVHAALLLWLGSSLGPQSAAALPSLHSGATMADANYSQVRSRKLDNIGC